MRLSEGGTFYFLEANATPSLEPFESFALAASWVGLGYPDLIDTLLSAARTRYPSVVRSGPTQAVLDLPAGRVDLEVPSGVHPPCRSSLELASLLDVRPGEHVLDLGCGCGLLAITAARLGARRVVATDLDPACLSTTERNAGRNGVARCVETVAGSWYEPLHGPGQPEPPRFHVVIATPPQTPSLRPFGPRYGGPDGTKHLVPIVDAAPRFLDPATGRLWLLLLSIASPEALLARLERLFFDVQVVKRTDRPFEREEYECQDRGLFDHLLSLRDAGQARFTGGPHGPYAFENLIVRASRPRRA